MKKNINHRESIQRIAVSLILIPAILASIELEHIPLILTVLAISIFISGILEFSLFYYLIDICIARTRKVNMHSGKDAPQQ